MDPAQMLRRCPSSPFSSTGWIPGWRLTFGAEEFGWEGALATLVPAEGSSPGVDHGLYRKVRLRVHITAPQGDPTQAIHLLAGDVVAYAYALDVFEGGLPSARYLGTIADAAEAAGAPDDYLADLRSRDCRSIAN